MSYVQVRIILDATASGRIRSANNMRRTIRDAARAAGVAPSTVRRWERRGLLKVARDWRGARVFNDFDVQQLQRLAGVRPAADEAEMASAR
jgi:hypothetical protein